MNKQTTLWLLLLVVGLAVAVWWQRGREEDDLGALNFALYEGVEIQRIKAFRVDHIERGMNVRLERDARGAWYLTDPILYPADLAVVQVLLDVIRETQATIVPEIERDAGALGFEPPRALFVVEEEVGGELIEHELELGHLDLDGRRLNVRKDGRLLRMLRKLDTTLKRSVNDFRSRRALQLDPQKVVELNRVGQYQPLISDIPVPMELTAIRDSYEWRALTPREGLLDPRDLSVVLVGAAMLRIDGFIDEDAPSLAEYGLDPPEFRIELRTADGASDALRFGRKGFGGSWNCCREGDPLVFGVAQEDVWRLVLPIEELFDRHIVRVLKDEVQALRLECGESTVLVERGKGGWSVSRRNPAGDLLAPALPAEREKVEEILSRLEHAELTEFRLDERFDPETAMGGVYLELGDRALGGRIGQPTADATGRDLLVYQRLGDEFVSWVEPWMGELACTSLDEFRALDLIELVEVDLTGIDLQHGADSLRFERSDRGRWSRAGEEGEAMDLVPVLDPLIFLRAQRHLSAPTPALEDPVEVVMHQRDGSELRFRVGLLDEACAIELGGALSMAGVEDLHARLLAVFGG